MSARRQTERMTTQTIARRGLALVLSSPSGAGKTTLARGAARRRSQHQLSVSVTTRQPRPGERDGVDYHFVDEPSSRS